MACYGAPHLVKVIEQLGEVLFMDGGVWRNFTIMMGMDCGEQSMEAALILLIETGVMHADLHAGNILLSPDMQFIDFSLFATWRKSTKEQCWL